MIQETPRQIEFCGHSGGECPNTKSFCGIVTAVNEVDSKLFGQGKGVVRSLARHKGIDPLSRHLIQKSPSRAGHNANTPHLFRTRGANPWISAEHTSKPSQQFPEIKFCCDADTRTLGVKK